MRHALRELNPHWLMYALLVNWVGDMGAYYVGRRWGRHKMAPRISPNKSWEGAVASVAASVLVAGAYLWHFVPGVGVAQACCSRWPPTPRDSLATSRKSA